MANHNQKQSSTMSVNELKNLFLPKEPISMMEYIKSFGVGFRPVDDPFFKKGDDICGVYKRLGIYDIDEEKFCHKELEYFSCEVPNCSQRFDTILEHDLHYNSNHRFTCSECKKQLMSPHLLDLHISEQHDSFFKTLAERKPMYKCFVENCQVMFKDGKERKKHCIEFHKYPHDFKFDSSNRKSTKANKNKKKKQQEMEVDGINSEAASSSKLFCFGRSNGGRVFVKKKEKPIEMHELMESLPLIEENKKTFVGMEDLKETLTHMIDKKEEPMEMDDLMKNISSF